MSPAATLRSRGLWSLWDLMINLRLVDLAATIRGITNEQHWLDAKPPGHRLEEIEATPQTHLADIAQRMFESSEMPATAHRAKLMAEKFEYERDPARISDQWRVLYETAQGELGARYAYLYPKAKSDRLMDHDARWGPILERFPSCLDDAYDAVDCWAMEKGSAAVFHLMRVCEVGLRVIARERRVVLKKNRPIEYAEWEVILNEVQKKRDDLLNKNPPSPRRDEAVAFYGGVIGELQAFKDVYRNNVMHGRARYDAQQAESVLNHVEGFMGRLAKRLDENSKRQIAWRLK